MRAASPARLVLPIALAAMILGGCNDGAPSTPRAGLPISGTMPSAGSGTGNAMASPNETRPGAAASESAPSTGRATIVKAEIIPVDEGLPKDGSAVPHCQVIWDWKNDGDAPIGTLKGDVRAYDKDGKLTYEAKDVLLFAKYNDPKEAVAPGATNGVEKGQGHSIAAVTAEDPVRAEIAVTYTGPITKLPG